MALLSLSHTPPEDQLYRAMLANAGAESARRGRAYSVKGLAKLSKLTSLSTTRRALSGLLGKLSVESTKGMGRAAVYQVFNPEEIFERRRAAGLSPYPKEFEACEKTPGFYRALGHAVGGASLSRREAQVALACVEGITNAEIGRRLSVTQQTVKFHLRNIFIKCGVKRRTELISRLLQDNQCATFTRGIRS
jgi:DNA-binding CsgD family transcriptional regulator